MSSGPYYLAIGTHKGGTGRTTVALTLASLWGRAGLRITLVDADPSAAAGLIALNDSGVCPWPNVCYRAGMPAGNEPDLDTDVVIIDCPILLGAAATPILSCIDGVILTCVADAVSLRTVPAAAGVLSAARIENPKLELLGVLISLFTELDAVQLPMLDRLRQMHGDLLLEPPVPYDLSLRDWPLTPGAELPEGPGADALGAIADRLHDVVCPTKVVALEA